jgi:hypothetical protein
VAVADIVCGENPAITEVTKSRDDKLTRRTASEILRNNAAIKDAKASCPKFDPGNG